MSRCPDCNAKIYGSMYCAFCGWGKSAGSSRLDALRAENAALKERLEAQRAVIAAQDWLIRCVNKFAKQKDAREAVKEARARLREIEGEVELEVRDEK